MSEASGQQRGLLSRELRALFAGRPTVLVGLFALLVLVYGFQLFNFNLSIDEEIHANAFHPTPWVSQWRWGMAVLNRVLLPFTVVPVVPLALGLGFHMLGVLVLLRAWDVVDPTEQFLIGAVALATPTLAYLYVFDTINYGVGVGLFMTAASIALFARHEGSKRYLAALPAAFALAIYQTFALALVAVYLVWAVRRAASKHPEGFPLAPLAGVVAASGAIYAAGQVIFMAVLDEGSSGYVEGFFDLEALRERPGAVVMSVIRTAWVVYRGEPSVYAHRLWALPILLTMLLVSFSWIVIRTPHRRASRIALLLVFPLMVAVPFAGGLLSGGHVALRFLVALPFALAGLVALGLPPRGPARTIVATTAGLVLLQFAVAANSLFGSSSLAFEQDRVTATRLIHEIELAVGVAGADPQFLEVVGIPDRAGARLIHRFETIGASFFEWDGGNAWRIGLFLQTLGYGDLAGLPVERRGEFVAVSTAMPDFPAPGSVLVAGDVVVVRFGPYTAGQLASLCPHYPELSACSG